MREDKDLEFLGKCSDEELDVLVQLLTKDKNGKDRVTETLTVKEGYKKYYPKHSKYWKEIAGEIQEFGGNSFVNIFRGGGVKYREILTDVCDKMGVKYNNNASTEHIEQTMLMSILEDSLEKLSEEEKKEILKELDIKTTNFTSEAIMASIQTLIRTNGVLYYKLALIVANAVAKSIIGKGLSVAGNQIMLRSISIFAGPIGWVLTGLWTAIDIAGPAYRVTIPIAVEIAFLRIKKNQNM
jgi:uncharacterized protein YaaW (UPF0174 family)